MATDGAYGRFNRAQRAIFNMDEGLPLFLANTLLVAPILGPVACGVVVPLYAYGRITLGYAYEECCRDRIKGFLFSMIAEHAMAAMVGLIALKATFGSAIPA